MNCREVREEKMELALCADTTGGEMGLICLQNTSGKHVVITVCGTTLRYGIPDGGRFYYVESSGGFVQTFSRLRCSNHEAEIRTGKHSLVFTEESMACREDEDGPVCGDRLSLNSDGTVLVGGYRFSLSPHGNPVVYVRDGIGIDSRGLLMCPREYEGRYRQRTGLISAAAWGELCITDGRKVLCRGKQTLKTEAPAMEIAACDDGYLVQTAPGGVYASSDGVRWQKTGEQATAIAAFQNLIAWADTQGNVYVCRLDESGSAHAATLRFPGKHITELAISAKLAAVMFADGTFAVLDMYTGRSITDPPVYSCDKQ